MHNLSRTQYLNEIKELFEVFPVVAILGARQVGKSTLARQYLELLSLQSVHYFDLESDLDQARLQEPQLTLESLEGLIVLDEIQRRPQLFPILRYLVDHKPQKYLILGSASRDLIQQSSESLAGRIAYVELPPFSLFEVGEEVQTQLWWRGGFPRSLLAASEATSSRWRQEYIKTFLERDLRMMGFDIEPVTLRRCWQMLAHYHGQTLSVSEIARSIDTSTRVIQRYLDILEGTFMLRQLRPWFENISKRQVKAAKIYFKDSGLFHTLLGIANFEQLQTHPKLGASWEGFALEEVIRKLQIDPLDCYFWATSNQAELDLLVLKDGQRLGFEFKYTANPKLTNSMKVAMQDLKLDKLTVIVPKGAAFPLAERISVCQLADL